MPDLKKIKEVAEFAFDTVTPLGHIVNPAMRKAGKDIGGRIACQKKGGTWVQGKCIAKGAMAKPEGPGPRSRTGKTKHSKPPERSSY